MSKQLIIAGFHRSGTSMLAQELHNAGLYIGDRLLGPNISNVDGHFEDYDFFNLHEKILHANNTSWQYTFSSQLDVDKRYTNDVNQIINIRNSQHSEWGFKDPRTALFLPFWQKKLSNPYTVVIYRHYEECVNSLLHRASRQIADNESSDVVFWEDPSLAYKMWVTYNKKIIEHIEKNPKTTIVVSHSKVLEGLPIIKLVNEKFGFNLNTSTKSTIKKSLITSKQYASYELDKQLIKDLEHTWKRLEELSFSKSLNIKIKKELINNTSLDNLKEVLDRLKIVRNNKNPINDVINNLENNNVTLENKITIITENRPLFHSFKENQKLINSITNLLEKHPNNSRLYFILSDIYKIEKKYFLAEFYLLKAFTESDSIPPYFYNNLAHFYLAVNQLKSAQRAIDKALKGNPNNSRFYMTNTVLNDKECDYKKSIMNIDKALVLVGSNDNLKLEFSLRKIDILFKLNQIEEIKSILSQLHNKYPNNTRIEQKEKYIFNLEKAKILNEEEKLLKIRNDKNYYLKIISILNSLDNKIAKNDLLSRIIQHLSNFSSK